ncbi:trace amine-associated receptor 1-like [Hippoglossus stenolepis]|uniref:trace amine-associated receptor 1-like n=1 Tax=Hippoglossus stenolepis TaxID=195615 RepID=UPI001FAF2596|nr:trace amine-associated receptor 1-like [Hippoglossus stenolepis]
MEPEFIINKTGNGKLVYLCYEPGPSSCIMEITPSTIRTFLYVFIGSTLSVLTISGNLLVITSIVYFKQLHTPTNYLILSLAMADLLLGALVLQFNLALSVQSCLYFGDLVYRYYAVCQPLSYRTKMNGRVVLIMILVSWTASALSGFGIMFVGLKNTVCEGRCFIFHIPNSNVFGSVVSFYLPVIIMLCIYLKIFIVAQRQARSIHNTTCRSTKSGAAVSKMEKKATKTLATVMGVFLFCWMPFFLYLSFHSVSDYSIPPHVFEAFTWLGWSNSMLNPFVYAFFYRWFRAALRIIISGKIFSGNFRNSKLL